MGSSSSSSSDRMPSLQFSHGIKDEDDEKRLEVSDEEGSFDMHEEKKEEDLFQDHNLPGGVNFFRLPSDL